MSVTTEVSAATEDESSQRIVRVLIVDDADTIRVLLRGMLSAAEGIDVVGEAGDGEEAIALARRLRPDVVLMDVTMPVMNGIQATGIIVEEMPDVRVLGLSISQEVSVADAMVEAGAAEFLTKGGVTDDLVAAVRGRPR